jgi:hypothetical protein
MGGVGLRLCANYGYPIVDMSSLRLPKLQSNRVLGRQARIEQAAPAEMIVI